MDADTIMRRLHELKEENKRLKSLLAEHGIPFEVYGHDGNLTASQSSKPTASTVSLSLQEKVELFQSLFEGRNNECKPQIMEYFAPFCPKFWVK